MCDRIDCLPHALLSVALCTRTGCAHRSTHEHAYAICLVCIICRIAVCCTMMFTSFFIVDTSYHLRSSTDLQSASLSLSLFLSFVRSFHLPTSPSLLLPSPSS
jgi:hypothetical protein